MGWDVKQLKNPHLRDAILAELSKTAGPAASCAKIHVVDTSMSTIINTPEKKSTEIFFSAPGLPVGKPRMTQRDTWAKRPCVMRYREYADRLRKAAGTLPVNPLAVHMKAYLPMPDSWSKKKKAEHVGRRHRAKPDADNILKCVDALFDQDSCIAVILGEKFWCQAGQEKTDVYIIYDESVLSRYGIGLAP